MLEYFFSSIEAQVFQELYEFSKAITTLGFSPLLMRLRNLLWKTGINHHSLALQKCLAKRLRGYKPQSKQRKLVTGMMPRRVSVDHPGLLWIFFLGDASSRSILGTDGMWNVGFFFSIQSGTLFSALFQIPKVIAIRGFSSRMMRLCKVFSKTG